MIAAEPSGDRYVPRDAASVDAPRVWEVAARRRTDGRVAAALCVLLSVLGLLVCAQGVQVARASTEDGASLSVSESEATTRAGALEARHETLPELAHYLPSPPESTVGEQDASEPEEPEQSARPGALVVPVLVEAAPLAVLASEKPRPTSAIRVTQHAVATALPRGPPSERQSR